MLREWINWLAWFVPSVVTVVFLVIQGWLIYAIAVANGIIILGFVLMAVFSSLDGPAESVRYSPQRAVHPQEEEGLTPLSVNHKEVRDMTDERTEILSAFDIGAINAARVALDLLVLAGRPPETNLEGWRRESYWPTTATFRASRRRPAACCSAC